MKKRLLSIMLTAALIVTLVGCGSTVTDNKENQGTAGTKASTTDTTVDNTVNTTGITTDQGSNILIVYFTRADNVATSTNMVDAVASASINVNGSDIIGNNTILAQYIQEITGGDTFSIQTVEQYPQAYRDTTDQASDEKAHDARPGLANHIENMDQYDVIFLGYPNWWGTIPMAINTFLEEYDFTGKTIIPFASHEGSGLGSGPSAIEEAAVGATVLEGFAVRGSAVSSSENDLKSWIDGLNL